ncbi:MAG: flagellar biosynthesis protein FliQ [Oceanospirillaceae bacterium]|nr:flagellar biosynthesis protein FliQ [Oceanospirillaceae bacterium]
MSTDVVLDVYGEAFMLIVILVAVIITPSLMVGLLISMFQAATQINEQTLSFLPRLIVTLTVIMVMGPWIVGKFKDLFSYLFHNIPYLIG